MYCILVINKKAEDSFFIQNPQHLNPQTLFRPSNFERYLNQLESKQMLLTTKEINAQQRMNQGFEKIIEIMKNAKPTPTKQ